jgi:hypothetical protein
MPLQATSGAASYDAFGGGGAAVEPNYIESCFSTWLYSGTSNTQTITNGIDLAGKGGLVWTKMRNTGAFGDSAHWLFDTARGVEKKLSTNTTSSQSTTSGAFEQFNSNGYQLGYTGGGYYEINYTGNTYASWTFRKQPKFFDVVTYTGTGSARTVAHNLGSAPGCIIVKNLAAGSWYVYHRSTGNTGELRLNATDAVGTSATDWNSTDPTSTVFSLGASAGTNANGASFVAYLFAHDAGGFGLSGTDNVISCGSYAGNSSTNGPTVNLGYEPQWVMIKNVTTGGAGYDWYMADNMRGIPMSGNTPLLAADLSAAESGDNQEHALELTATGFKVTSPYGALNNTGNTYIYIAIRRGPMKVPTDGTSVYNAISYTGDGTSNRAVSVGFTPDMTFGRGARSDSSNIYPQDRLRGLFFLSTQSTAAEGDSKFPYSAFSMTGIVTSSYNNSGAVYGSWAFKRAPGFFDEVCYTGDSAPARAVTHNLGVAPELIFFKLRNTGGNPWWTYAAPVGATKYLVLNTDAVPVTLDIFANTAPTSSVFYVNGNYQINYTSTVVAYLFASCPGVSKVGTYTGTGTTQTINCGFTAGSRFVLIKRTDSTGDWYVWDSARGIVAGNDPYLLLNSTAAEVTGTDYVDTAATGFEISSTAPAAINANGGTFIFLAIA